MLTPWRLTLAVLAVLMACCCLFGESSAQQFYPNGRYGRRSVVPPLADSTRDIRISYFGDETVTCKFTGYSDYYSCTRKETSSDQALN